MKKQTIALIALAGSLTLLSSAYARDEGAWDSTQAHVQTTQAQQTEARAFDRADNRWDSTRAYVPQRAASEQQVRRTRGDAEKWDSTRHAA